MSYLEKVQQSVETANGLPNEFYTDATVYAEETKRLLHGQWAGVAFEGDVPEIGDVYPVDLAGVPLVVVRDRENKVRVYENVCRHRGMILVSEPGKAKQGMRCPYHSWTYDLSGRLVATPLVGGPDANHHPCIDKPELGLLDVPTHVYLGVVYVNVSRDAGPFVEMHSKLLDRWSEFQQPLFFDRDVSQFTLDVACNWKLAVENYCEAYHLPWIHPDLNSYSRIEDHYNIVESNAYSGQGTTVFNPSRTEDGRMFDAFSDLSANWWNGQAEYIVLYPNVLAGVHRDHVFAMLLLPQSVNQTRERVGIFYASKDSMNDDFADLRRVNAKQWRTVFDEDISVVEGMQQGRNAPHFDGGRFSPAMDVATHCFHAWVAKSMSEDVSK